MSEISVSGLSCQLSLPLSWSVMADEAAPLSQAVEQQNLNRLHIILGLDDSSLRELHEEESGLVAEIQRLDFKINIVLELVSHLVTAGRALPEAVSATLSHGALVWESGKDVPPQGARIELELFFDLRFPFPLVLHGRVESLDSQSSKVTVVFDPFPESIQEMLEKYVFRCHRRHIARLKKRAG